MCQLYVQTIDICAEAFQSNSFCSSTSAQRSMAHKLTAGGDCLYDFPTINDLDKYLVEAKQHFEEKWDSNQIPRAKLSDFERFRTVGEGAFGRVMLVRHKPTHTYCAMKIMEKATIVAAKQVEHVYLEMKTLISVQFPFIVSMLYALKDNSYIYFALPFIVGGEMFAHLRKLGRFTEDQARFYAVQVCLGLEYLHYLNILYRDLKPENILIDCHGYLKIADLGFCKIVKGRTYTFCGTPEYIAPEIILSKAYGKAVDWWSYGVLLYEMNSGYPPFSAREPMQIYEKILSGRYKHSYHFSKDLQDLTAHLLELDPTKRYGSLRNGVEDIKRHRWFKSVNWLNILNYRIKASFVPRYTNEADAAYFGHVREKPLKIAEKDKYEKIFEKF